MEEVCIDDCKNIGPWQRRVPVLKYNFHQLIQSLKPETLAETIESDPRNKSVAYLFFIYNSFLINFYICYLALYM